MRKIGSSLNSSIHIFTIVLSGAAILSSCALDTPSESATLSQGTPIQTTGVNTTDTQKADVESNKSRETDTKSIIKVYQLEHKELRDFMLSHDQSEGAESGYKLLHEFSFWAAMADDRFPVFRCLKNGTTKHFFSQDEKGSV